MGDVLTVFADASSQLDEALHQPKVRWHGEQRAQRRSVHGECSVHMVLRAEQRKLGHLPWV